MRSDIMIHDYEHVSGMLLSLKPVYFLTAYIPVEIYFQ